VIFVCKFIRLNKVYQKKREKKTGKKYQFIAHNQFGQTFDQIRKFIFLVRKGLDKVKIGHKID